MRDKALLGIGAGSLMFGAAGLLAPKLLAKSFGVGDQTPRETFLIRAMSARNAAVGAISVLIEDEDEEAQHMFLRVVTAMSAADLLIAVGAAAAGEIPPRTAAQLATVATGFGVVAGCATAL
jgi:hypothetical protein